MPDRTGLESESFWSDGLNYRPQRPHPLGPGSLNILTSHLLLISCECTVWN